MLTISAALVVSYSTAPIVSLIAIICSICLKRSSNLSIFYSDSGSDPSYNSFGGCSTFLVGLVKRFLMRLVELLKKPIILLSDSLF